MEWFTNIGQWFVDNREAIIAFFSSGTFVTALITIINTFRQYKAIKNNTDVSGTLNVSLEKTNKLNNSVVKLTQENESLKQVLNILLKKSESTDLKLNAILEVQSIVYSSLKDEQAREVVNNILVNAMYSGIDDKAKLLEEIKMLKENLAKLEKEHIEAATKATGDTIEKVKKVVEKVSSVRY